MSPSGAGYYCSLLTPRCTHIPTHTHHIETLVTYKCWCFGLTHTPGGRCVRGLCFLGSRSPRLSLIMPLSPVVNGCPQLRDTQSDTETCHKLPPNKLKHTYTHTHTHNWKWMSPISIIPTQDDTKFPPHSSPSRSLFQSRYLSFTHTPYDPHSHQRVRKWSLNLHVWLGCTCQNSSRRHGMKLNVLKTVSLKVTDFSTRLPTGKRLDCLHIQYVMHLMYF